MLVRALVTAIVVVALAGCAAGPPTVAPSSAASAGAVGASAQASVAPGNPSGSLPAGSAAASAPASARPPRPTSSVTIANFAFDPTDAGVKVGASLTWKNSDSVAHTVTFGDGSQSSGKLAKGATFKRTFTKAGTFVYHCSIHPTMRATVVVSG